MNRKHRIIIGFLLFLLAAAFYPAAAQNEVERTDGLDRTVVVRQPVERIITLSPSLTEIVCAVGACGSLVAVDNQSDFPEAVTELPQVVNMDMSLNLERIVSLSPDLVLLSELYSPEQVHALEKLGITVWYEKNPLDFEGLFQSIYGIGQLAGHAPEASALCRTLQNRVHSVEIKLKNIDTHPSVFYEIDATDSAKPWTTGPGTFMDVLIRKAGGTNAAAELTSPWAQISQEQLILTNPEIIILGDTAYGVSVESIAERPGWDVIRAVENQRVYPFDDDLSSRPGPRLIDALEQLAALIHPECYK